jgi:hypothetical protein
MNKKVFIGSSSEGLGYAEALHNLLLEKEAKFKGIEPTLWKDGPFILGETTIESLEHVKVLFDYAIFVFTPDDHLTFRSNEMMAARDNVIFEFGLFVGTLGIKKTFALIPDNIKIKQPSDLLGVTFAPYNYNLDDKNIHGALRSACGKILKAIEKTDKISSSSILIRGDHRNSIVDASIDTILVEESLYNSYIKSIRESERVKEELLYYDRHTAQKWLDYENVTGVSARLISDIGSKLNIEYSFDLVSLGPGSGKKETAFLSSTIKVGRGNLYWYYPIDISSHLLIMAMNSATTAFDDTLVKIKGIRGDFNFLSRLQYIYGYRDVAKVFTLFGNTLGNYAEGDLIKKIEQSMKPKDIIVIEVNDLNGNLDKYKKNAYKEFILEPLKATGLEPKISKLKFETPSRNGTLMVPRSERMCANYYFNTTEKKFIKTKNSKLTITHSTHYDKMGLIEFVEGHGLNLVAEATDSENMVLAFKK